MRRGRSARLYESSLRMGKGIGFRTKPRFLESGLRMRRIRPAEQIFRRGGGGRPGSCAEQIVKPAPEWGKRALRAEAEDARAELQAIEKRLSELETEDEGGTRKS